MRKILFALILLAFTITVQMPFFHVLDMEMENMSAMNMSYTTESPGDLCNNDASATDTQSCYTEISESKWLKGVRKIELTPFFTTALFVFFAIPLFFISATIFRVFSKRRIFYNPTLYLGLYGIIRNVN